MDQELISTLARAQQRFPGYLVKAALRPVAVPVIDLNVSATCWERYSLSAFEKFFLRSIWLGQDTIDLLGETLGLDQSEVIDIASEMIGDDLLEADWDAVLDRRRLRLTDKGTSSLNQSQKSVIRRRSLRITYYPFSESLSERLRDSMDPDEASSLGSYIPPFDEHEPSIGELNVDEFRVIWEQDSRNRGLELIEPVEITRVYKKFLDGYTLVVLDNPSSSDTAIAVYKGINFQPTESAALQRINSEGKPVVPKDALDESVNYSDGLPPSLLTEDLAQQIQGVDELLGRVEEIQIALEASVDEGVDSDNSDSLKLQLASVENEIDAKSYIVTHDRYVQRVIKTQEHRGLLLKALQEAGNQVYISSASLNHGAVDEEFLQNLKSAIDRGVSVYIAWGLMAQGNNSEAERNRIVGRECNKKMLQAIGGASENKLTVKMLNNHMKFVICDSSFAVTGSFNWLGWKGGEEKRYRHEISVYSEDPELILELKTIAENLFIS